LKALAIGGIQFEMLTDSMALHQGSLVDAGKERIEPGPIPDWVVPCTFAPNFKPSTPGQVTYLLWDKQLHAEKQQEFTHAAVRLETLQAVQRESEWRLECDPRRQTITVHWIRIHRGEQQFDQTRLENLRPIPGASEGRQTLGLMLEDVRLGDVLEWCYTVAEHPIAAGQRARFFALPDGAPLGKLFLSVRFSPSRRMKWKASAKDLAPAEAQGTNDVQWVWARENLAGSPPEENTPEWCITHPWIQVSDYTDWETVAANFAAAWNEVDLGAARAATPPGTAQDAVLEQAQKAIDVVQDEYRALADAAELDAEPPVAPDVVARRRFGSSKDLSFLLAHQLRELGLTARLVIVNTKLGKSLRDLLPASGLFNHVVVEIEMDGQRRWIDVTAKGQGGGLRHRIIRDFGVGLPVAQSGSGLMPAPAPLVSASAYEIKETLLLDTSGATSLLGVVVTARGSYAEDLRRDFETLGGEAISRQRLQKCIERFGTAARVGTLNYRDNRKDNEFFLAEIFEVKDFLEPDAKGGWFRLNMKDEVLTSLLKLPDSKTRRAPLALPYPCDAAHTFEVYCVALAPGVAPEKTIDNPWLQFTWSRKMLAGNWVARSTLWTLADAVPPEDIEEYRETVQEIHSHAPWSLVVPAGLARPHQRTDFGALPAFWESAGATKRTPMKAAVESAGGGAAAGALSVQPGEIRYKRRKRHRRRRREKKSMMIWGVCFAGVMLALLVLFILELTKGAEHILPPPIETPQAAPAPPPPADNP
jgi:hypothetical protein